MLEKKEQFLSKLKKMEKLDKMNCETNEKFSKGITTLMSMKFSNSNLKYLDPIYFGPQKATTFVSVKNNNFLETKFSQEDENFFFFGIDQFARSKKQTKFLKELFSQVFQHYVDYANYLNSVIYSDKKTK